MFDEKLTGNSMGERRKAFNSLVSAAEINSLTPEDINSLTSKTQGEQVYMSALAGRFKNHQAVWQILKSENEMTIKRVLKYKWFFEKKTDFMNTEYIFKEIFPNTSYRVRSKVISRLGIFLKDENMADEFYERAYIVYGKDMAEKILPACSLSFIKSKLTNPGFEIQFSTLIKLYKRDTSLIIEYIDNYFSADREKLFPLSKKYSRIDCELFWNILVQDSPETFLRLFVAHGDKLSLSFGYRTSIILLKCDKKTILEHKRFTQILNTQAFLQMVKGEDLDKVLIRMLPDKKENFNYYEINNFLKTMKPNCRLARIIKIYSAAYPGASLLDSPQFVTMNMSEQLNLEDRIAWAEKKIANVKSSDHHKEDYYLKYLLCSKAIPRYMELCQSASILSQRISLLEKMVQCCKINNDDAALLNIMKYVAKRHRNDAEELRYNFLNQVHTCFKLHKLSPEHWEVIDEMLQIMYLNEDIQHNYRLHFLQGILQELVRYRLDRNVEIESVVDTMMKFNLNNLNLLSDNIEYERKIMHVFFERCRLSIEGKPLDDAFEANVLLLLNSYSTWNSKHKEHKRSVTDCPWLLDEIKRWMNKSSETKKNQNSILYKLQDDAVTRQMFAEEILRASTVDAFLHNLLDNNITVFSNNIDLIVNRTVQYYSVHNHVRMFHRIRAYMQKPIGDLMDSKMREMLTSLEHNKTKAGVVMTLSLLLNIDDFETLVEDYIPKKEKIDVLNKDLSEYNVGEVICGLIKRVNPPVSFGVLSRLAKGDYLKFILGSVLSVPYKKSSKESVEFIKSLGKQPVSIKKHAIRLAYFIYPRESLLNFYKDMWEGEKNSSMREVIFKWTFKYMTAEPELVKYREIWQLLKSFFNVFEEKDKNNFGYLTRVTDIRPEIVDEYSQTAWSTLKMLKAAKLDVSEEFASLTRNLESVIHLLSDEFCEIIIQEYLSSVDGDVDVDDSAYLLKFFVCCIVKVRSVDAQEKHIASMRKVFEKYITENWNKKKDGLFIYRKSLKLFVSECCIQARENHDVNPIKLLTSIGDMLKSVLPFDAVFDSNVLIELSTIYKKHSDHPGFININWNSFNDTPLAREYASQLGASIGAYMLSLYKQYGPATHRIFNPCFEEFDSIFFGHSTNDRELLMIPFIGSILANSKSTESLIFAIDLLPSVVNTDNVNIDRYNAILKIIREEGDNLVKIVLNSKYEMSSAELFGKN